METLVRIWSSIVSYVQQMDWQRLDSQWLLLAIILVATSLVVMAVGFLIVGAKSPLQKRLAQIANKDPASMQRNHKIENTLESLAPVLSPSNQKEQESVRNRLMNAGYHQNSALTIFYAIKTVLTMIGVGIGALIYYFVPDQAYTNLAIIGAIGGGLFLPNFILRRHVNKRQERMRSAVPDALDLLVVCTESGLGFNMALQRVAKELYVSHPEFSDELDTVCVKIKAGISLKDALNELIRRTGLYEINGLVKMLNHASKVGGSLAQTLREYNDDYRDRRQQEAEEIAAKIPTKMLFPMILFIWPCFFIVAIGPALITIFTTIGN